MTGWGGLLSGRGEGFGEGVDLRLPREGVLVLAFLKSAFFKLLKSPIIVCFSSR